VLTLSITAATEAAKKFAHKFPEGKGMDTIGEGAERISPSEQAERLYKLGPKVGYDLSIFQVGIVAYYGYYRYILGENAPVPYEDLPTEDQDRWNSLGHATACRLDDVQARLHS
jgi:hypothetical protein